MPELPIVGPDGALSPIAPMIVAAIVLYPNNERARAQYAAHLMMQYLEHQEEPDWSRYGYMLPILHRAPAAAELDRRAAKIQPAAEFAASALLFMLSAAIHHPQYHVSPTVAVAVLPKLLPKRTLARSSRWRAWTQHRSVAHLNLATSYLLSARGEERSAKGFARFFFEHFDEYLGLAETIRALAVERRLLGYDASWRVPASVAVPRIHGLPFEPLSDEALAALAAYVPEHSRDA